MPQPLALCENGHFFRSGVGFDTGGTGVEVNLTVESAPRICPACGADARVLGGTYHIAENTIKLLQGPERTVSELERLRQILREARESGASPEEVKSTVQREFPEWGQRLAKLLVPKTPGDFYTLLTFIVAVITALLAYEQLEQAKNTEPDQIINDITVVQEAPAVPGQQPSGPPSTEPTDLAPTTPAEGRKVGRNEPCPCGSGVKFKRCHGANGATRYGR